MSHKEYKAKMKDIGMEIRVARIRKKMSQAELAKKVSVTKSAISDWENGNRVPNYFLMEKIKEALGKEFVKLAKL